MRNCLVIDLDRCSGCDGCVAACKLENNVDLGVCYNRVHAVGPTGTFPDIEQYWIPLQCQQCENPGCIEVCPTLYLTFGTNAVQSSEWQENTSSVLSPSCCQTGP